MEVVFLIKLIYLFVVREVSVLTDIIGTAIVLFTYLLSERGPCFFFFEFNRLACVI